MDRVPRNYYGTPTPEAPPGTDVVLEIEVDGAQQIRRQHPEALLVFVLPPSREEQERRLRGRGDAEDKVAERLRKADDEEPVGLAIADEVVVNDDLDRDGRRAARHHRQAPRARRRLSGDPLAFGHVHRSVRDRA